MLGPVAGYLDFINIHVENNETEVVIIVESDFLPFKMIVERFNAFIESQSHGMHAEASVLVRSDSIAKMLSNDGEGLNALLEFDFKIDSILLDKLKSIFLSRASSYEPMRNIFAYLIQEIQL